MINFITASAEPVNPLAVLVTGFVIVFVVLLLLIGIIKLYSSIVSGVMSKVEKKNALKVSASQAPTAEVSLESEISVQPDNTDDMQIVAVISAAVAAYYGSDSNVRVHSIRRSKPSRSEWATAGINENIMSRRGF